MPPRLKSLELHGYKTFASRTEFQFPGVITAIVGPNGSGKSNIADALRWVLGEQSYSLLRGRKTEDMIFAGSELRPRAGMASATVLFDNSDGWLPIDFSEVAITRRAYRDGENEYLLNGQRVRLKDVSELLAQSGLAERTYTIIGQGLVDAALSLKAEERRRLFEEAAGIGLHRARREEALKRLEATSRNLERVEDILAELQPRLRSLERQARRAQEYEQVKADLRVLLREWYGYHWRRAQRELAEAREAARARENVLERVRAEQAGLAGELAGVVAHIQALRNRLGDWHRQSSQLHARREIISRELAVSDERARSLGEQCQDVESELARLEAEQALLQESLTGAIAETAQLQSEVEEGRGQVETARRELQELQKERSRVEGSLQAARQSLAALTAQQAHLQARRASGQANLDRQMELLRAAASAMAAEENELRARAAALAETDRLWQEARANQEAVQEKLNHLRQRLAEAEAARQDILEQRAAQEAQAARLLAQLEILEQAEENLAGYAGGARLLIQAAREERLKGVRGILGSLLSIPAEYDTAIAAALGEFVDAVVLDTGPEPALDLIDQAGAPSIPEEGKRGAEEAEMGGRAALLPLPEMETVHQPDPENPSLAGLEEVLGTAAGVIEAPAELRGAIQALLGQALLVRDRPAAQRVLERLRACAADREEDGGIGMPGPEPPVFVSPALRVVTLRGEVYYAGGPVLAHTNAATGDGMDSISTPLSRPRQMRELRGQLEEANRQRRAREEQALALDQALRQLHEAESRRVEDLKTATANEERQRSAQREADLAAEKARRQIQWRREEQIHLEDEIRRNQEALAQDALQLQSLEKEIAQARQLQRELNEQLARLSLDELQTRLSHWVTRLAVAERALAEATRRRQERQAALERAQNTQVATRDRLAAIRASIKEIEAQKSDLRQEEVELARQIEALRVQIEPNEADLEAAEKEQARLQSLEAAARQSLALAEHHHAQARILLVRRQEALESLRRRIEDDADYVRFGLVAFEYAEEISGQSPLPLDGMVEQLPVIHELSPDIEENIKRQRAQLRRIGPINPEAQAEYLAARERFDFLRAQVADLTQAQADIHRVIAELDALMEREFRKTFEAVAGHFHEIFARLFGGGTARLLLTNPDNLTETGIEIEARLPGRRSQGLALLSGGERSLTAAALVFSLLKVSPTPFCVLDEVDAMLDEANVGRFRDLLRELSQNTQFIVVTHNRNTVQVADVIYGVTMGRDSASQVLSLKLDEVDRVVE